MQVPWDWPGRELTDQEEDGAVSVGHGRLCRAWEICSQLLTPSQTGTPQLLAYLASQDLKSASPSVVLPEFATISV